MKRHINGFYALLLLVSCINNVKAQQYYSILDHINKWAIFTVEIGVGQDRSFFGGSGYLSSQDTIMDSIAYKWIIPDNNFFLDLFMQKFQSPIIKLLMIRPDIYLNIFYILFTS